MKRSVPIAIQFNSKLGPLLALSWSDIGSIVQSDWTRTIGPVDQYWTLYWISLGLVLHLKLDYGTRYIALKDKASKVWASFLLWRRG
jgi:hypothetical protein